MTRLALHLLGTFHLIIEDKPASGFATDKARALLAYLAVERRRPHRREYLAALLWPEQSDERARQSLRQALSHLRQSFAGHEILRITPQDVQLNPEAALWTDVAALHEIADACQHHHHRSLDRCLPCLHRQEAIAALYQGDFLSGFSSTDSEPFEEWVLLTRENLHQQAMRAHTWLADFHDRRGENESALRHVREQVRLEPWREEAHRQAMHLLARSDQRSAALAQFEACRLALETELGVQPTRETVLLYEQLKNGAYIPPTLLPTPPAPSTSFVGRSRELTELANLLAAPDCRLLTLIGPGGAGKTRLALQAARDQAGLFADGVLFVPLASVGTSSLAVQAIADALGLPAASDPLAQLCETLRGRQLLLVLDNFEQVVDGAEAVARLLASAPGLVILVTSRERLRLVEEQVFSVEGLPYPADGKKVKEASAYDALILFEQRAARLDRHFHLTPEALPAITRICRLVEGSPLGLELAAATASDRTCEQIADALQQRLDALASDLRNIPERHRSLRAAFEYSWNLLLPGEQVLLAKLSVFEGGFDAAAAEAVAEADPASLADLIAKSLLRRDLDGRYALHEIIRQFAAEKLEQHEAIRSAHGAYYGDLVARSGAAISAKVMETFTRERLNLLAAWRWSLKAADRLGIMQRLLPGITNLYSLRGPVTEGEELLGKALRIAGGVPSPDRDLTARISLSLAQLYKGQMKLDEAVASCREIAETAASPGMRAKALLLWGQSLGAQGECEASRPILERALALGRALGDQRVEADSLRELGNAANRLAELDVAIPLYELALALARELGDRGGESATLNNLGTTRWDLGDLPAARSCFVDALAIYRELGDRRGEAKVLNNLSNVAADQGDLGESLRFCQAALHIHQEMNNRGGQSNVLHNLGSTLISLGKYAEARQRFEQALDLFRESGNRQAEAEVLANLGLLDGILGNFASGRDYARQAIVLSEQSSDPVNWANAQYYLGQIELEDGNYQEAEAALTKALDLRREVPHPGRIAELQTELAYVALRSSRPRLALERLAPVLEMMGPDDSFDGTDDPAHILWLISQVLSANGDTRARAVLERSRRFIEERAAMITDPELRKSYLENIPGHQEILS